MKLVLASNNSGKIREFKLLLKDFHATIVPQSELGIDEIKETGLTFIENAIMKARHASLLSGLPAIADDSGLCVAALSGAPGIYSARYAGEKADAKKNIEKLLAELSDIPDGHREAYFHCVLVFLSHAQDPTPLVCEGKWYGHVLHQASGNEGFGYDPIFYLPSEKKTAAELPLAIKNKISHRGIALDSLLKLLPDKLHECSLS